MNGVNGHRVVINTRALQLVAAARGVDNSIFSSEGVPQPGFPDPGAQLLVPLAAARGCQDRKPGILYERRLPKGEL